MVLGFMVLEKEMFFGGRVEVRLLATLELDTGEHYDLD